MGKDLTLDVSVILTTYHTDLDRVIPTLKSVAMQRGVSFEVIVADDGSGDFDQSQYAALFSRLSINKHSFVINPINQGTVKNVISGVNKAVGKYVYTLGPGDLLYDERTLRDFVDFCEANNCKVCFGHSIYYAKTDAGFVAFPEFHYPRDIRPYEEGDSKRQQKNFLLYWDLINATSYFFKTEFYLSTILRVDGVSKFAEDASFFLMVADGDLPLYFDRNLTWYEYGSGISTNPEQMEKWGRLMKEDQINVGKILAKEHPKWKVFDDINVHRITPKSVFYALKRRLYHKKHFPALTKYDIHLLNAYFE